jgi:carboxyl-terminal processing protease
VRVLRGRSTFGSGLVTGLLAGLAIAALIVWVVGIGEEDDPVVQAREVIQDNYFKDVPSDKLEHSSIKGMVDELRETYDDRFSHYFTPEQLEDFESATSGHFSGVGLAVNEVPRGLRVALVYPDTPAAEAGIAEGDVITAVDGKSIEGVPADVSTARIKGPPGSDVELRLVEAKTGDERNVTVERASVRIPAVQGEMERAGGHKLGWVRFATFSEGAHGELRDELERLYREGAEGAVIDLRGNGGGLLNEAVLSASVFVEDGVIVSTRSRTQGERDYEAVGDALDPRPTVVLVNRDSASASEILTAALQEYDLATVVGTRTFGKGTFQEVIGLPAGGAVDLTVGQYLTADGTSILGEGVKPDVRAEDDPRTPGRGEPATPADDEGLQGALDVLADEISGQ